MCWVSFCLTGHVFGHYDDVLHLVQVRDADGIVIALLVHLAELEKLKVIQSLGLEFAKPF
jgi:hypothetical protein